MKEYLGNGWSKVKGEKKIGLVTRVDWVLSVHCVCVCASPVFPAEAGTLEFELDDSALASIFRLGKSENKINLNKK
jgi:hypothetical protein